jgi:hypothetical protein
MSINLGFYDFFSYLIPGLLYLYVFNEFLHSIGQNFIDIASWFPSGQAPSLTIFIPLLLAAYLVGHLIDPVAQRLFKLLYHFRNPKKAYARALDDMKNHYPELNIEFEPKDWNLLLSFIRHRNLDMAHILDKFNADAIMLVNIALGMFALVLIQMGMFFSTNSSIFLINSAGVFVLFLLAAFKCNQFRSWFFIGIFQAALEYGKNLREVVENKIEKSQNDHGQSSAAKTRKGTRAK